MPIADIIKWDASDESYAWKFPSQELSTWSQLIVAESQEAVLVKEGRMFGPFKAGRYTLSTKNIPILSKFIGIPYGNKSPFTAEVWFINKSIPLDIKWGTSTPIQLQDPKYGIMLPVRAFGQYGVQIDNAEKFLIKLVGTKIGFHRDKLRSYFKGLMLTKVKDAISKCLVDKKISLLEASAHLDELSEALKEKIQSELQTFGVKLINFYVNSINSPKNDPAVKQLKAALAKKAEMNIIGYDYTQERSFDTLEGAAKNLGSGNTMNMGMGMGMGMGIPLGNSFAGMMNNLSLNSSRITCKKCNTVNNQNAAFCSGCGGKLQIEKEAVKNSKKIVCDKCGTEVNKGLKFCPQCGDPFNCCPECGTDNLKGSPNCYQCGKPMPVKCKKCNIQVPAGSIFCSQCGAKILNKCKKCDTMLTPNLKFCPQCGEPTQRGDSNE